MMKKPRILLGLLASGMLLGQQAQAQSWAYFFPEQQCLRTVVAVPGLPVGPSTIAYVGSETVLRADHTNAIHLMCFDANQKLISPWPSTLTPNSSDEIDVPSLDERNVDIIATDYPNIVQVSYVAAVNNPTTSAVRLVKINLSTGVVTSSTIRSTDPTWNSLVAADAMYDAGNNKIVICGTAVSGMNGARTDTKQAFVMTVDPATLMATNMVLFNSTYPPTSSAVPYDDDIATRVVLTSGGNYYVTGSENVTKLSGVENMGIRSMLLTPALATLWSAPLALSDPYAQNGVDMAEDMNGNFITLVNMEKPRTWGIIRISSGNGSMLGTPQIETSPEANEMGHNISVGNNSNELVVKGMKQATSICGGTQTMDADPFLATLNVNNLPATMSTTEYLTTNGNWASGQGYWTMGGSSAPSPSLYPIAIYANTFADRIGPNTDYCILAPIFNSNKKYLNTKSIHADGNTINALCPTLACILTMVTNPAIVPSVIEPPTTTPTFGTPAIAPVFVVAPTPSMDNCNPGGVYKPTGIETVLQQDGVSISPNPANNSFSIALGDAYHNKRTQIALCDVTGKKIATVFDGTTGSDKISYTVPNSIASGMYFVHISSEGNTTRTEKIIINK